MQGQPQSTAPAADPCKAKGRAAEEEGMASGLGRGDRFLEEVAFVFGLDERKRKRLLGGKVEGIEA